MSQTFLLERCYILCVPGIINMGRKEYVHVKGSGDHVRFGVKIDSRRTDQPPPRLARLFDHFFLPARCFSTSCSSNRQQLRLHAQVCSTTPLSSQHNHIHHLTLPLSRHPTTKTIQCHRALESGAI